MVQRDDHAPSTVSVAHRVGLLGIGMLTVGWFGTSWRILGKPLVEAVGDTVGGVSMVLLGVSVIGALMHPDR